MMIGTTNKELAAEVDMLYAVLAGLKLDKSPSIVSDPWLRGMTKQERGLVGYLYGAYPVSVTVDQAFEAVTGRDFAEERSTNIVPVLVCRVRKVLGKDAILNDRGVGFRLSPAAYERLGTHQLDKFAEAA
jgi:DNA-binding response OmpR family regulator